MNLNLKVGDPQQKNNIVVFFLSSDEKKNDSYLSFSQALEQKLVDVSGNKGRDDFPSLLRCLAKFIEIRSNHLFLLFH